MMTLGHFKIKGNIILHFIYTEIFNFEASRCLMGLEHKCLESFAVSFNGRMGDSQIQKIVKIIFCIYSHYDLKS